jgi:hypothetical protein
LIEIARLNPSGFDELKQVDDGFVPNPDHSIVVVARNEQRIIGRLFAMSPSHVEGVYIEERYRGGSLFKELMEAMEVELRAEKISKVLAYAVRPEIANYLERRCGYSKLSWTVMSKDLGTPNLLCHQRRIEAL